MICFDFTGKTAVVIGSSRGIGRAIAESLLRLNCSVIITSRGDSPEWSYNYPRCTHKQLDFLDRRGSQDFIHEIESLEAIDILVNNAGIQIPHPIYDVVENDWNRVLRVNLYGPMSTMRAVSPKMKASGMGRILNISSIAGVVSKPGQCAYSASKAGLIGLTRASALDMASYNVLVNALCPGPTQTDMVETILSHEQKNALRTSIPLGRFAHVEEIANFAVFLCSDLNTYITGQIIIVDGGATAL